MMKGLAMSWFIDRCREKNSQVAISALAAGCGVAVYQSGVLPIWAAPLVPLAVHVIQIFLTPDIPPVDMPVPLIKDANNE